MINLLEYKRETHNKDFFRAVRNDSSIAKRVGTYAVSSVIVGGLAGAIFLLPAVGPLVAAPTLITALSYSGNFVLAGLAGGVGYSIHRSLLHKDNVLSKAEKSLQKAAKIEKKFADYKENNRDMSDRKYARMIKARDRKLMYFDTVHDVYHRKVDRLATKLGYKLSDEYIKDRTANPFVAETDAEMLKKQGRSEWLNNRRAKKLVKKFEKLDDLHEDYLDYLGIKGNDMSQLEEFSKNLDQRRVINRTKRGLSAIKGKIFNPESAAERQKKREEREKEDTAGNPTIHTPSPKGGISTPKPAAAEKTSWFSKWFRKSASAATAGAASTGKPVVIGETAHDTSFEDALENDQTIAPAYVDVSDLSLFDQLVMSAQIVASDRDRLNLVKHNEDSVECIQPRFAFASLSTKKGFMKSLQKESVSNAPYPIADKVTVDDACEYYKGSYGKEMQGIKAAVKNLKDVSNLLDVYIDSQNLDTNGTQFLVQLDFDNPKFTVTKEFDNAQKALAFTQLAESTAREQKINNNCDGYRITTWTKRENEAYQVALPLSAVVVDPITMEQAKERMYNSYLYETMNLHRTLCIVEDRKIKDSTTEIIKIINSYTGMPTSEKEIVKSIERMPMLGVNTLIADEIALDAETFSKRDKQFRKEQFCRNPEVVKA